MIRDLRVRVTEYSAQKRCRLFRDLYLDPRRRLSGCVAFFMKEILNLYAQPATKTLNRSKCAHRPCEGFIRVSDETMTGWLLITGSAQPRINKQGGAARSCSARGGGDAAAPCGSFSRGGSTGAGAMSVHEPTSTQGQHVPLLPWERARAAPLRTRCFNCWRAHAQ